MFLIRGSFGVFGYSQSNNQSTFLFAAEQQNTYKQRFKIEMPTLCYAYNVDVVENVAYSIVYTYNKGIYFVARFCAHHSNADMQSSNVYVRYVIYYIPTI